MLARAHDAGRVLVTLDKDFGEFAVVRGLSAQAQGRTAVQIVDRYHEDLAAGGIVTVQPGSATITSKSREREPASPRDRQGQSRALRGSSLATPEDLPAPDLGVPPLASPHR